MNIQALNSAVQKVSNEKCLSLLLHVNTDLTATSLPFASGKSYLTRSYLMMSVRPSLLPDVNGASSRPHLKGHVNSLNKKRPESAGNQIWVGDYISCALLQRYRLSSCSFTFLLISSVM